MTYSDTSSSRSSDSEDQGPTTAKRLKSSVRSEVKQGSRRESPQITDKRCQRSDSDDNEPKTAPEASNYRKSEPENVEAAPRPIRKEDANVNITNRTGGAYIPPAKLRMMQKNITDKSSEAYQRLSWDLLKKSIHGLVNKVNAANITQVVQQLFAENLIRGRGLFAKSVLEAQAFSPTFTPVYAALIAIVNSKFPQIGELILRRLVLTFRKSYRRNAKAQCVTSLKLVAHLVNQSVAHEVLSLEILLLLLKDPVSDAGVELAIALVKEVGQKLTEVSPRGMNSIFERLRQILHEGGAVSERVQYMIELAHAVRKDGFKNYPSVPTGNNSSNSSSTASTIAMGGPSRQSEQQQQQGNSSASDSTSGSAGVSHSLDLVCEGDQITHLLRLDEVEPTHSQDTLNVFKSDPSYLENEAKYDRIKKAILGADDEEGSDAESGSEGDSGEEDDDEASGSDRGAEAGGETGIESSTSTQRIVDKTETDLMGLRRTVYLTIQSSLSFEECAHKLLKLNIKDDQIMELCQMVVDCCAQQRSYERFYGLLASKFCLLKKEFMQSYEVIFKQQYETIHRLDSNKLRNTAKLFAHMLYSDSLPWTVIECIHLNENETTSSGRIFIKYLFQELSQHMGLPRLHARLNDPTLALYFEGIFPRDNPKHTRFAINMFTSIGLGGLTDELRAHIASVSANPASALGGTGGGPVALPRREDESSSSSSDDDDSSSSSSSSSESSSTSSDNNNDNTSKTTGGKKKERNANSWKMSAEHRGEVISNSLHTSPQHYTKMNSSSRLRGDDDDVKREPGEHDAHHHNRYHQQPLSASVGHTPTKKRLDGGGGVGTPSASSRGDNLLRRAAIEHQRRQNRKMSSSSEDEANNNKSPPHNSRRPYGSSRPSTPRMSTSRHPLKISNSDKHDNEAKDRHRLDDTDRTENSVKHSTSKLSSDGANSKERRRSRDREGKHNRKSKFSDEDGSSDKKKSTSDNKSSRRDKVKKDRNRENSSGDDENENSRKSDKKKSSRKSHRARSSSNSRERDNSKSDRRRSKIDVDKENRSKKSDRINDKDVLLYAKEVKKVQPGLNVADALGQEIVSQYDKMKEEKVQSRRDSADRHRQKQRTSHRSDSLSPR